MASSRVMASSSPSPTASDLARFAAAEAAAKPGSATLGSMNMEEILRNIYGDLPPAAGGEGPASPSPAPEIVAARTAEEVWREISGGDGGRTAAGGAASSEMTLEDFLAREGAVGDDEVRVSPAAAAAAEGPMVMGFGNGLDGGGGGGGRGRKRQVMDSMDRAAIQRQKRMIKNRESAARSRERKQAYIAELESLVSQLEEENAQLLREQEEQNQKRLKELKEQVIPVVVRKKPQQALRRTNSMEW